MEKLIGYANKNIKYLENQRNAILSSNNKDVDDLKVEKLNDFFTYVSERKRMSINIKVEQLYEVLFTGRYLNVFELGYTTAEIRERYDKKNKYYDKLILFTDFFSPKRNIKYAYLNTEKSITNSNRFGKFCIFLDTDFIKSIDKISKITCLQKFSLTYVKEEKSSQNKLYVLEEELKKDMSFFNNVEDLVLLKHAKDIEIKDSTKQWSQLINDVHKGELVEAQIMTNIPVKYFKCITVKEKNYREIKDLEKRDFLFLKKKEKLKLEALKEIEEFCSENNIPILRL